MKICFVADIPTNGNGGNLQCYLIAKGLLAVGWEIVYITLKKTARADTDFPVYHAALRLGDGWLGRYFRGATLFTLLRRIDPEIVVVSSGGALSGFLTLYALLYRKRIVLRAAMRKDALGIFAIAHQLSFSHYIN